MSIFGINLLGLVETGLWNIVPFIIVMSAVVFFHEWGHFIVGRWCGVKVDAFSIGFGPELFALTDRKGTRWRIAAIPLGGYVKFHGDANGASMVDKNMVDNLPADEVNVTFFGQKVWKRAAIVAAGPLANFLLAIVIFSAIFFQYGKQSLLPRVGEVLANSAAESAGLKTGDLVLTIDGRKISSFLDMQAIIQSSANIPLHFEVERGGLVLPIVATPKSQEMTLAYSATQARGVLGLRASNDPNDLRYERYGLVGSVGLGIDQTWYVIERTGSFIGGLFVGTESTKQLSGPIRIAEVSSDMAKLGFGSFLYLIAILSVSIGLMNLLPIPVMDGGHLVLYLVEAVKGSPLNGRVQEYAFRAGLSFVVALMILATFNDITYKIFG